jgi:hypothetical protein
MVGGALEGATAAAGVAGAGTAATAVLGQSWLVPVIQVAVSVAFIVMAIDKRMARLHESVNHFKGKVEVLEGRIEALEELVVKKVA